MGNNEDYFVKRPSAGGSAENRNNRGNPDRRIVGTEGSANDSNAPRSTQRRTAEPTPRANGEKRPEGTQARRVRPENGSEGGQRTLPTERREKKTGLLSRLTGEGNFAALPEGYRAGSVDMVFLVILAIIIAFGTVMVFSSSHAYAVREHGDGYYYLRIQLIVVALGCLLVALVALFPLKTYAMVTWAVYIAAVLLLIAVLVFGISRGEAKRWLRLPGGMTFQPSELGKTAVVMMLALYMSRFKEKIESKKLKESFLYGILMPGLIVGVIVGLVFFENHFSGIIIICAIAGCMMIFGGTKMYYIAGIAGLGVAGILFLITLTPYANARLEIWRDPWSDLMVKGWQTVQGLYSIASGGIFGVGLGNSHQKYGYVSEPQNDFVFTIACEELGFVGALAIIILFALLVWRGFSIARHSPNRFTYLLVLGIISKIAIQVILNIAVVTNTIPNTGIPLPFFSSGGSSLLVLMAEMGVVLSVSRYSKQSK